MNRGCVARGPACLPLSNVRCKKDARTHRQDTECQCAVAALLSDNVGDVKSFWSVLGRALRRARHFALVEKVPCPTEARFQSVSGLELSPTHASLRSATSIMIASSNSPLEGAGCSIVSSVFY